MATRATIRKQVDELVDYINARVARASGAMEEVADHLVNTLAPGEARAIYAAGTFGNDVFEALVSLADGSLHVSERTLRRLFWVGIYNEVHTGEAWRRLSLTKKYVLVGLKDRTRLSEGVQLGLRDKVKVRSLEEWVGECNDEVGERRGPRIGSRNVTQMVRVGALLDERDRLDRLVASMAELPPKELDELEAGLEKTAAGAKKLLTALRKKRRG